jgi:hypothetical protein
LAGTKLWDSVLEKYALERYELVLLEQICSTADRLDELEKIVAREGLSSISPSGERAYWALVESRQQQVIYAKLLGALRLPDEHSGVGWSSTAALRRASGDFDWWCVMATLRKPVVVTELLPAKLRKFDPRDWPGPPPSWNHLKTEFRWAPIDEGYRHVQWSGARREWVREHGVDLPWVDF